MPRMARSIIIPDFANMELSIISSEFIDIPWIILSHQKGI